MVEDGANCPPDGRSGSNDKSNSSGESWNMLRGFGQSFVQNYSNYFEQSKLKSSYASDGLLKMHPNPMKMSFSTKLDPILLFYFSAIISKIPGTVYITPTRLCFTSSVLGLGASKEVFQLSDLDEVVYDAPTVVSASTLISQRVMKLSFFGGRRTIFLAPIAFDCATIKVVLEEVKATFA